VLPAVFTSADGWMPRAVEGGWSEDQGSGEMERVEGESRIALSAEGRSRETDELPQDGDGDETEGGQRSVLLSRPTRRKRRIKRRRVEAPV